MKGDDALNPAAAFWHQLLLPFITWLITDADRVFSTAPPLAAIGAFGLAVMFATVLVRLVMVPVAAWQRRQRSRAAPLIGFLVTTIQYPVLVGLYFGVRGAAGALGPGHDFHFLWMPDLTVTPLAACCGLGGPPGPGPVATGVLAHPLTISLVVLAAVATVVQTLLTTRVRPGLSAAQRRQVRVGQQVSAMGALNVIAFGMLAPGAIALYWIAQALLAVAQARVLERLLPSRRALRAGRAPAPTPSPAASGA